MKRSYSPIAWNGAKTKGCKILAEMLPPNVQEMVSIFAGGASFELFCEDELRLNVTHAYDVFEPLVNFWKFASNKEQAERLVERAAKWAGIGFGKEKYDIIRDRYNRHWRGYERIEDPFDLAFYFYVAHVFSFSSTPQFYSYSKQQDNERGIKNKFKKLLDLNTAIQFDLLSFEDSIPKHPEAFLYLDPPYVLDGVNLKGECYIGHARFDHHKLAETIKMHKGMWMMSYGDCELVRELYKDYRIDEVSWSYSMKNMDRRESKSYEVVIRNY